MQTLEAFLLHITNYMVYFLEEIKRETQSTLELLQLKEKMQTIPNKHMQYSLRNDFSFKQRFVIASQSLIRYQILIEFVTPS